MSLFKGNMDSSNKFKANDDIRGLELIAVDNEPSFWVLETGDGVKQYIWFDNSDNLRRWTTRPEAATHDSGNIIAGSANAGADIILGSHSHATQTFRIIETQSGSVPVIYSLGNFISSMSKTMHKDGVMVNLVLEKEYENETTSLIKLTYTPTYCTSTDAGRFVVLPADLQSIRESDMASSLENSRERTIKILSDTVAAPE